MEEFYQDIYNSFFHQPSITLQTLKLIERSEYFEALKEYFI